ncbi:YbdK family carboxylate-amine ligase [Nocardioides sp. MH1]|uniref:carboxylate-amine ligase n=1 Tax=Nocardioides sp. MH1 TaxID=3242490 RepID=UPI003521AB6E
MTTPGQHPAPIPDWPAGSEFTLGVEDELLLVDEENHLLGASAAPLLARLRAQAPADGVVKGEIFADEVELETPVCADAEEVARSLGGLRGSLVEQGARLMAAGVHPAADIGTAALTRSPRYDLLAAEFGGLLRTPTAGFQVHVGVPDAASAVLAFRGLRNRLALFRALAAGSPYWHGRDSGLACVRPAILRSYPRTTMPPVLRSWDDYLDKVGRAISASEVPDYTYVCWELRPQPRLGTIEVRVMDAQHSLATVAGLAALVQGVARCAVEDPDPDDLPEEYLLDNDFRACRHGLDAMVLDSDGCRRPLREVAATAVAGARRVLGPDGLAGSLDVVDDLLTRTPEPTRQRHLCEGRGMAALLADLAARTMGRG